MSEQKRRKRIKKIKKHNCVKHDVDNEKDKKVINVPMPIEDEQIMENEIVSSETWKKIITLILLDFLHLDLCPIVLEYAQVIRLWAISFLGSKEGYGEDQFFTSLNNNMPNDICIAKDELFVADIFRGRIQVFHTSNGRFLRAIISKHNRHFKPILLAFHHPHLYLTVDNPHHNGMILRINAFDNSSEYEGFLDHIGSDKISGLFCHDHFLYYLTNDVLVRYDLINQKVHEITISKGEDTIIRSIFVTDEYIFYVEPTSIMIRSQHYPKKNKRWKPKYFKRLQFPYKNEDIPTKGSGGTVVVHNQQVIVALPMERRVLSFDMETGECQIYIPKSTRIGMSMCLDSQKKRLYMHDAYGNRIVGFE